MRGEIGSRNKIEEQDFLTLLDQQNVRFLQLEEMA
jgi:hypothetical protein